MASRRNLSDKVVDCAVERAAEVGWANVRLHDVADDLGLSLSDLRPYFCDLNDVADAWFKRADVAMLATRDKKGFTSLPPRERISAVINHKRSASTAGLPVAETARSTPSRRTSPTPPRACSCARTGTSRIWNGGIAPRRSRSCSRNPCRVCATARSGSASSRRWNRSILFTDCCLPKWASATLRCGGSSTRASGSRHSLRS